MSDFFPMRLAELPTAFDHSDFIFEIKYDGFRALAHVAPNSGVRLVSRKANVYKSFPGLANEIGKVLAGLDAILDGEIVHLGAHGRPLFYDLLRRRSPQHFCAFDLLSLDGRDLRAKPLHERKRLLRQIIPPEFGRVIYADHFEQTGRIVFEQCCAMDLEGVVAKHRHSKYEMDGPFRLGRSERTSWAKIKNPSYSQAEGRQELFEKRSALV